MKKFIVFMLISALWSCSPKGEAPKENSDIDRVELQTVQTLPMAIFKGEITYRQRIAMPTPFMVEVQLFELEGQSRKPVGDLLKFESNQQVPVPYIFGYDSKMIDKETKSYGLEARFYDQDNNLQWKNAELVDPFSLPPGQVNIVVNLYTN